MDTDTVITYSEDSYVVTILSPENGGGISLVNSPDADYWWHIGKVAVNSDQNHIAIVFQEGRITLNKISKPEYLPLSWIDVLEKGDENQLQTVEEAIFDPSGRWLAVVRGQYLAIWQVNGWKRELFRDEIDNFRGMMFTPSSELLFIAKENTVSVISLEEREVVFEMQSPGIASLDISDDNRLLFWGDENGAVHVWGIPLP